MNIRETIMNVVARREREIFLVDANSGREITYKEFHRQACALAAELRGRGLNKGDRVGVMIPNCCELAIVYFACLYMGAVIVPVNPALSRNDVEFILSSCKPVLVVVNATCEKIVDGIHSKVIGLVTAQESVLDFRQQDPIHLDALSDAGEFVPLETANVDDLAVIMYTSGTSAKPKGLAHKLGRMIRNAEAFARVQGIDQDSRFYLTLSMAYMGGFYNLLLLPFLCGSSVVVDHVFDARSSLSFWGKAKSHNVNTLWLAPTILSILLRMDRGQVGEEFCRNSLRHIFVGFAPLPLKVKNEFETRYGVRLIENYGLSETLFVTARSQNKTAGRGYVGEALPGVDLRVVNDQLEPADPGCEGEIQVLSPDLMAGYLDAHGKLLSMDSARWFSTGDVGHFDRENSLFITGRRKDLIIRGGVNISPAAVEEVLMQVEGVAEVAVVSIPHELYGEDVVAVLRLFPGIELESRLEFLIAHARQTLAQHQQPSRYITMEEFPRTVSGKVQKARIRELVVEKLHASLPSSRSRQVETAAASR